MPQAVVDRLEAVQIEDHDPDQALLAPGPGERALQAILKQRAVGEPGQLVVLGEAAEPLRLVLAGQSVADGALEAKRIEPSLVEEIGDAQGHGLEVEIERAGIRQQDDRGPAAAGLRGPHQLQAIAVGQGVVDQADVEAAGAQPRHSGLQIARPVDHEADVRRDLQQIARRLNRPGGRFDQQDPHRNGRRQATRCRRGRPPPWSPRSPEFASRPRPAQDAVDLAAALCVAGKCGLGKTVERNAA